jgi:hypothetical protein
MMRAFVLSILVFGVSATLLMLVLILGVRSACKLAILSVDNDNTENMPSNPDIIQVTQQILSKKELKHPITREKISHQKM